VWGDGGSSYINYVETLTKVVITSRKLAFW